jgi:hypothetical protein
MTPYHQPGNCVEPNVGHVVSCTWNWLFERYHEPIVGCFLSSQQIWLLYLPFSEHGVTFHLNM